MRFIDPTIYASRRSLPELELMATAGVVGVVEPSTWYGTDRRHAETFLDDFERQLGPEARRALPLGLGYAACVGVTPREANNLAVAHRVLDALPRFLGYDRVVAIGEIGLERGTGAEEEIFRRQLRLAQAQRMPVVVQTPIHDRREALGRTLALLVEEKMPPNAVLINGITEETLPLVLGYGCWYGLTIDRNTHLPAERAVHLLQANGLEGAMIHSAAGRLHGDPLAVPRMARLMLETGFSHEEVETLTYHNPKWFFSQARPLPLPEIARSTGSAALRSQTPSRLVGYASTGQAVASSH